MLSKIGPSRILQLVTPLSNNLFMLCYQSSMVRSHVPNKSILLNILYSRRIYLILMDLIFLMLMLPMSWSNQKPHTAKFYLNSWYCQHLETNLQTAHVKITIVMQLFCNFWYELLNIIFLYHMGQNWSPGIAITLIIFWTK